MGPKWLKVVVLVQIKWGLLSAGRRNKKTSVCKTSSLLASRNKQKNSNRSQRGPWEVLWHCGWAGWDDWGSQ